MITLTAAETSTVVINTIRLAYMELSFEGMGGRVILQYGSTAPDGTFTEASRKTMGLDSKVAGFDQVMSNTRDAFEALLLVAPPVVGDVVAPAIVAVAATQVTEAVAIPVALALNPVLKPLA
jgi:hypothetical protein